MVVAQFLLTFREGLEAALIVGIVVAYLTKVGRSDLRLTVYAGSAAAVVTSAALGIGIAVWAGVLSGWQLEAFEGIAALVAVAVLTYMIFWMARNARKLRGELEQKIDLSLSQGAVLGIAVVAFVAVFREGVETVLFLSPYAVADPAATAVAVIVAIGVVLALAYLVFRGMYRLDARKLFTYTSLLLIVFAAGLVASGVHALNEVYEETGYGIPPIIGPVWDLNPPVPPGGPIPPLHEDGAIGSVLASLFGYNGDPSLTEVVAYFAYLAVAGTFALWTYGPGRVRAGMLRVARALRVVAREPAAGGHAFGR